MAFLVLVDHLAAVENLELLVPPVVMDPLVFLASQDPLADLEVLAHLVHPEEMVTLVHLAPVELQDALESLVLKADLVL